MNQLLSLAITFLATVFQADQSSSAGPFCSEQCPLVFAELTAHIDPGHFGGQTRYEVGRVDDSDLVRVSVWPRRVDRSRGGALIPRDEWIPDVKTFEDLTEVIREFLHDLAADDVCNLDSPEKYIGLHPTFVTLSLRDGCGNRRTVEWVTENCARPDGKYCPGGPYADVYQAFQRFVEQE